MKKFVPTQKRTDGRVRPQWLTYEVVKSSKGKRNARRKYQLVPTKKTMKNTKISLILPPKSSGTKKNNLKKEYVKILREIQKLCIKCCKCVKKQ